MVTISVPINAIGFVYQILQQFQSNKNYQKLREDYFSLSEDSRAINAPTATSVLTDFCSGLNLEKDALVGDQREEEGTDNEDDTYIRVTVQMASSEVPLLTERFTGTCKGKATVTIE